MKYCFVILHYKVAQITIDSIYHIFESCAADDFHIIVVDNNSGNGSLEKIRNSFTQKYNIEYVEIERNVGFAKGNNIGYSIAKHKYNAEFIIVMNNDVFITQINFCECIQKLYSENEYDILGPDIITKDGYHQNPLKNCICSKSKLNRVLAITRLKLLLMPFYNIRIKKNVVVNKNEESKVKQIGKPLHGSCLIYSRKYIDKHEYAFYPDTFLYAEEDILYYLALREKLNLLYSPMLSVIHNEDAATNFVCRTNKEKRKFQLSNSLQSLLLLKKLMNEQ